MKIIRTSALAGILALVGTGCGASFVAEGSLHVTYPPQTLTVSMAPPPAPPPNPYASGRPASPGDGYIWVEGYYTPRDGNYVWVEGQWAQPQPGTTWQPPAYYGGAFYPGFWRPIQEPAPVAYGQGIGTGRTISGGVVAQPVNVGTTVTAGTSGSWGTGVAQPANVGTVSVGVSGGIAEPVNTGNVVVGVGSTTVGTGVAQPAVAGTVVVGSSGAVGTTVGTGVAQPAVAGTVVVGSSGAVGTTVGFAQPAVSGTVVTQPVTGVVVAQPAIGTSVGGTLSGGIAVGVGGAVQVGTTGRPVGGAIVAQPVTGVAVGTTVGGVTTGGVAGTTPVTGTVVAAPRTATGMVLTTQTNVARSNGIGTATAVLPVGTAVGTTVTVGNPGVAVGTTAINTTTARGIPTATVAGRGTPTLNVQRPLRGCPPDCPVPPRNVAVQPAQR